MTKDGMAWAVGTTGTERAPAEPRHAEVGIVTSTDQGGYTASSPHAAGTV